MQQDRNQKARVMDPTQLVRDYVDFKRQQLEERGAYIDTLSPGNAALGLMKAFDAEQAIAYRKWRQQQFEPSSDFNPMKVLGTAPAAVVIGMGLNAIYQHYSEYLPSLFTPDLRRVTIEDYFNKNQVLDFKPPVETPPTVTPTVTPTKETKETPTKETKETPTKETPAKETKETDRVYLHSEPRRKKKRRAR